MPIIAKDSGGGTDFAPCPAGAHQCVCSEVVDLGMVKTNFEGREATKHMVRIYWEVNETRDDGKRYLVSKRYTLSLHERAALRKSLESWRGVPFSPEDLSNGFDVERLVGANAFISVVHNDRDGKKYADVAAIMPLPRGMSRITVSPDYVKYADRKKDEQHAAPEPPPLADDPADDDSLPF